MTHDRSVPQDAQAHIERQSSAPDDSHEGVSLRRLGEHNRLAYRSRTVLRLGRLLLGAGASSYRVKTAMRKLAFDLGIQEHHALVTMTEIAASAYSHGTFRTEVVEERAIGVNADLIDRLNRVVKQSYPGIAVEEVEELLNQAVAAKKAYPLWASALASGLGCAGFAFLNGGSPLQMLLVFIAAGLGQALRTKLLRRKINHFGVWALCAATSAAIYVGCFYFLDIATSMSIAHHGGVVASILYLVPGWPLVTAIIEIIRLDLSAAIPRLTYASMLLLAAGASLWITTLILSWSVSDAAAYTLPGYWQYLAVFLASFVAAYAFAVLFSCQARACFAAALTGAIVNTARFYVLHLGLPRQAVTAAAALLVGLCAAWIAAKTRHTRISLSVPAAVIMLPGAAIYQSLAALNSGENQVALEAFGSVLFTVLAIGVGLALARLMTDKKWRVEQQPGLPKVWRVD